MSANLKKRPTAGFSHTSKKINKNKRNKIHLILKSYAFNCDMVYSHLIIRLALLQLVQMRSRAHMK